jgi:hypothetical protein
MTPISVGEAVAGRYQVKGVPREFPGYTGYRAFDREVEVEVSLWWVHPELYPAAADRERFLGAARNVRAMKNPNARRLFDVGEIEGRLFATAQLATGERLQDKVAGGARATDAELLGYAVALCEALSRAHESGFVHGRLVPDDVVTVSGLLKIGGIGLWHNASDAARRVWGASARYVAPEAWEEAGVGPRADVFSAAAILAELACGGGGAAWNHGGEVRELRDEISLQRPDIATELCAALADDPDKRPQSPRGLLASLRVALVDEKLPTHQMRSVPPSEIGLAEPVTEIEIETRKTNGKSAPVAAPAVAPAAAPMRPTEEIAAIDRELDDAEATSAFVRRAPSPEPGDAAEFSDTDLAASPVPANPPARQTGEDLSMPLVADPSKELHMPPALAVQPPRADAPSATPMWLYVGASVVAAGAVAAIAWLILTGLFGDDDRAAAQPDREAANRPASAVAVRADAAPAEQPVVVAPAPQLGPCPDGMAHVESYCIDAYESPGQGRMPEVGMTLAMAENACSDRGARLCTDDEWERACRGPSGRSFPYGSAYRKGRCNTPEDDRAEIGATGSFPDCNSDEDVYDMSGNVAEWVVSGRARGGSARDETDGRCSRRRRSRPERAYDDVGYRCCADAR